MTTVDISNDQDPNFDTIVEDGIQHFRGSPDETKAWFENTSLTVTPNMFVWVGRRQDYVSAARYVADRY